MTYDVARITSPAELARTLGEMSDASLIAACFEFVLSAACVDDMNSPMGSPQGGGMKRGKRDGHSPGYQRCPGSVKRILRLAEQAKLAANEAADEQSRRAHEEAVAESIGGFVLAVKEGSGGRTLVARRRKA